MEGEEDSTNFLSLDTFDRIYTKSWGGELGEYPHWLVQIHLGPQKTYFKRSAYTILEALGDFGGLNDALFLIIGSISTAYSAKFYSSSLA